MLVIIGSEKEINSMKEFLIRLNTCSVKTGFSYYNAKEFCALNCRECIEKNFKFIVKE